MKITLEEMRAFIAVVDSGSVTAAAAQNGLTVSAISRALLRLEEKMNSTLLYRTTRRLKLSEEGALFLQKARDVVQLAQEAEDVLMNHKEIPSGTLSIDASTPVQLHVIAPLVTQFHERYPQIRLELTNFEGITNLLEKQTDNCIPLRSAGGFFPACHADGLHPAADSGQPALSSATW